MELSSQVSGMASMCEFSAETSVRKSSILGGRLLQFVYMTFRSFIVGLMVVLQVEFIRLLAAGTWNTK